MDSETRSISKFRKTQENVTFESNGNFPHLLLINPSDLEIFLFFSIIDGIELKYQYQYFSVFSSFSRSFLTKIIFIFQRKYLNLLECLHFTSRCSCSRR